MEVKGNSTTSQHKHHDQTSMQLKRPWRRPRRTCAEPTE